jgi:hypothetical protein
MQAYIFSSFTGLPERCFQGYCFSGADYIFGEKGSLEYEGVTGKRIGPGLDGCYVSVGKENDAYIIGGDYSGFKKIFYYQRDSIWCVSNSIELIVRHMSANGARLTCRSSQIEAQKVASNITTCQSTFKTIFNEVFLLPSYSFIKVDKGGLVVLRRSKGGRRVPYEEGLAVFLETWVSRFETLLVDSRVKIGSQLTGGKDSRAVFAMLQRARQRIGSKSFNNASVISGRSEKEPRDYEIAELIANAHNIPIQGQSLGFLPKFTTEASYLSWRTLSLGLYNPIYFSNNKIDGSFVQFSGIGGENHRPFYNFSGVEELLRSVRKVSSFYSGAWEGDLRETMAQLLLNNPSSSPLIEHYREFRSRIHGGRTPQNLVCFPPLSGGLLENLLIEDKARALGQVNFDIMESALPGLWDFDYDKPTKSPTLEHRAIVKRVPIRDEASPGGVYLSPSEDSVAGGRIDPVQRMALLASDFAEAIEHPSVRSIMGAGTIKKCLDILGAAESAGKFNHAWDGQDITRTLTVALALKYADH